MLVIISSEIARNDELNYYNFIKYLHFNLQLDRFERRILLFWSGTFVVISLAAMGAYFYLQLKWRAAEASALLGWLSLAALIVFFVSYSSGFANVPFVIMGELFPSRYRFILGPILLLICFVYFLSFAAFQ